MADLPLQDVPRDCEIVELVYELARPEMTHLDLRVAVDGAPRVERRLRFTGPRVVQFQSELPEVLRGLDVQDVRAERLGDLSLWVSVAGGAVTFWARAVSEITASKHPRETERAAPPLVAEEQVRAWEPLGVPPTSFRYRTSGRGGLLRHFSVSTRPYGGR